jgi:oxaloacetate decarboxylase gamma subunit
MNMDMIYQALTFMMLGMGVVFLFLTIMIYMLKLQAYLIQKFVPTNENSIKPKKQKISNNDTIAAITAAIFYHNNRRV